MSCHEFPLVRTLFSGILAIRPSDAGGIMLKVNKAILQEMEDHFSGILDTIRVLEDTELPSCPRCHSNRTAEAQVGITGRTILHLRSNDQDEIDPRSAQAGRLVP
jgi:hypothetical protein